MKHPSIRLRLLVGTGVVLAVLLSLASVAVYRSFEHSLSEEIERSLIESAVLVAKSSELETTGVVYEWQEALDAPEVPQIAGLFQLWDLKSQVETRSPDLGDGDLPFFHGVLNEPVVKDITLANGKPAKAVGLLHYPFTDVVAEAEAKREGRTLRPESYPQVVVCAREVGFLKRRLTRIRQQVTWGTVGMLFATWGSIFGISTWCLRPIRQFSRRLTAEGRGSGGKSKVEIPNGLPSEMLDLAVAFQGSLGELELAREREKEFVLHAAHELRTPVAGIMVTLEQAILRPREAGDLTKRIQEALGITSGMQVTLESLMHLARLRGGHPSGQSKRVDVVQVVGEIIAPLKDEAAAKGIDLRTVVPEPFEVDCEEGLLRVVVSNLTDNALSHSPAGSTVEFVLDHHEGGFTFMTMNPKGGLTEGDLQRVFEPFQRASGEGESSGMHAGLGLSLAREASGLMGGHLKAGLEGGSVRFSVTIPKRGFGW